MTNSENDHATTYGVFGEYITDEDNKALIDAIPEAAPVVTIFNVTTPLYFKALKVKAKEKKGLKDESELALDELTKELVRLGMKASVLAEAAKNFDLAKQIDHKANYLTHVSMNLALDRASNWRDALDANKASVQGGILTNISDAEITGVDALFADFKSKYVKPKAAKKDTKTKGTELARVYMKTINKAMEDLYKLMYGEYIKTKETFVKGMGTAKEVDHTGIHHTGVIVFCSYATPPAGLTDNVIKGVLLKLVEADLETKTNKYGYGSISIVTPDSYTLEISGVGLVTQTMTVILKKGKMLQMDIKMVKSS
ncbi:MAG: hypothetical protein WCH34_11580 [Bacteroidota bacterium]